jgi:hypothetical protein
MGASVEVGLRPPPAIPVEESFNEFVEEFGGELVSKLMPRDKNLSRNADYLFRHDAVVAELKCLEKNLFNNLEDRERIGKIIQKHASDNTVSGHTGLRWVLGQEKLPDEYLRDMLNLTKRTVETTIRSAKEQIANTKAHFGLPDAQGLLLLANDGNYFLESRDFFALTCQIMQERFLESSIDGFVYFTVNMPAELPGHLREMLIWVPAYRDEKNKALSGFVNKLGFEWNRFYERKVGQGVPNYQTQDAEVLSSMRFIKR